MIFAILISVSLKAKKLIFKRLLKYIKFRFRFDLSSIIMCFIMNCIVYDEFRIFFYFYSMNILWIKSLKFKDFFCYV